MNRISKIEQNYNSVDFQDLKEDLDLAEIENLDETTYAIAKYKAMGSRPNKIAKANAKDFGLRHAFWDIYAPVEENQLGQWHIEADADGNEFITRKDS